jgi:methylenetetrahydrofolate dehydrogenase (NADP+)/methenyltetrahydrofolate cyclohydrolase
VTATILDGKALAQEIRAELAERTADFIQQNGVVPTLTAVLVGEDPASQVYIRNKRKACDRVGIESRMHQLPDDASMDELLTVVGKLNKDDAVHGILVQLPLPAGLERTSTPFIRRTSA